MAKKKKATASKAVTQFTVDLKKVDLTAKEISSLKNQIAKAVLENLSASASGTTARKKEPFVKIIFGKRLPFAKQIK